MQDSFDSRMKGNSPVSTKSNSDKGWMFCSIALLVILIGAGVFGGIIMAKGNRDTNRLSEVEQQLKEKEAKIEELEKASGDQDAPVDKQPAKIDYLGLGKVINGYDFGAKNIEYSPTGKYLVVIAGVSDGPNGSGYAGVWYKSTESGSTWKELQSGQGFSDCSEYSEDEKNLMDEFKSLDDQLGSRYIGCYESGEKVFPE